LGSQQASLDTLFGSSGSQYFSCILGRNDLCIAYHDLNIVLVFLKEQLNKALEFSRPTLVLFPNSISFSVFHTTLLFGHSGDLRLWGCRDFFFIIFFTVFLHKFHTALPKKRKEKKNLFSYLRKLPIGTLKIFFAAPPI
jgi:hypothetical protein